MKITVRGVITSIMDIFALFIASLLLKCSDIKKWVIWVYIVLRVLDLLSNVYTALYPNDTKKPTSENVSLTAVGILALLILIMAIGIFIIDIYVLYKMYKCETVSKPVFWTFVIGSIIGWIVMGVYR